MCMLSLVWDVACWRMLALRKAWHFSEGLRTATQKPLTVRATMSRNTQDPHGGTAVQKPCRLCVCDTTGIPPQFPWKLQPVTGTLKRFLSTCRAEVLSCCYRICSELCLSSSKHVQTKHSNLALKFWIWIPGSLNILKPGVCRLGIGFPIEEHVLPTPVLPSLEVNLIRIGLRRGRDCPAVRQQFQFQ